jgi:hypothetical protein
VLSILAIVPSSAYLFRVVDGHARRHVYSGSAESGRSCGVFVSFIFDLNRHIIVYPAT